MEAFQGVHFLTSVELATAATSVTLMVAILYLLWSPQKSVNVPYVGLDAGGAMAAKKKFQDDATNLLKEGYRKAWQPSGHYFHAGY